MEKKNGNMEEVMKPLKKTLINFSNIFKILGIDKNICLTKCEHFDTRNKKCKKGYKLDENCQERKNELSNAKGE